MNAYILTVVGALAWFLTWRSVAAWEARGEVSLSYYFSKNSRDFLTYFTLVSAAFALASLILIVYIDQGFGTVAFVSHVEESLDQLQLAVKALGLSPWLIAAILVFIYLMHLVRLPEDVEFGVFAEVLPALRSLARSLGFYSKVYTPAYLIVVIAASFTFFAAESGPLNQIVSAYLSGIPKSAGQIEQKMEEAIALDVANYLIDRSFETIGALEPDYRRGVTELLSSTRGARWLAESVSDYKKKNLIYRHFDNDKASEIIEPLKVKYRTAITQRLVSRPRLPKPIVSSVRDVDGNIKTDYRTLSPRLMGETGERVSNHTPGAGEGPNSLRELPELGEQARDAVARAFLDPGKFKSMNALVSEFPILEPVFAMVADTLTDTVLSSYSERVVHWKSVLMRRAANESAVNQVHSEVRDFVNALDTSLDGISTSARNNISQLQNDLRQLWSAKAEIERLWAEAEKAENLIRVQKEQRAKERYRREKENYQERLAVIIGQALRQFKGIQLVIPGQSTYGSKGDKGTSLNMEEFIKAVHRDLLSITNSRSWERVLEATSALFSQSMYEQSVLFSLLTPRKITGSDILDKFEYETVRQRSLLEQYLIMRTNGLPDTDVTLKSQKLEVPFSLASDPAAFSFQSTKKNGLADTDVFERLQNFVETFLPVSGAAAVLLKPVLKQHKASRGEVRDRKVGGYNRPKTTPTYRRPVSRPGR